ncbi:MAG TPA: DUF72 domain-containing protein [Candidatus Acidoferrales bacterium]|jgi:uncharacterized protein YecE (DUF72 family)|nr:DUF72 domain-containing protein [Candidatus Acidoferrales bacterium]
MGKIYAGTSGWAYASWKPDFYPAKLAAARFLNHYATRLNSVEVNYTFRRMPSESLLQRWVEATPADFQFALKAPQAITHIKRLRDTASTMAYFMDALEPLLKTEKLGPALFQLPGNFKCDVARLREFLTLRPRWLRAAFEFRDESWFVEDVYAALREAGVALCLAESEDLETPQVLTADFSYLRLRKPSYSAKALTPRVRELARSGDVYVYLKHEDTPEGASTAEAVLKAFKK